LWLFCLQYGYEEFLSVSLLTCEPQNVVNTDVGSPSCFEVQKTRNELLEDQACVFSESSLSVSDSLSHFREVDELASEQRAAGDSL